MRAICSFLGDEVKNCKGTAFLGGRLEVKLAAEAYGDQAPEISLGLGLPRDHVCTQH